MRIPNWYRVDAGNISYYTSWHIASSGVADCAFSTRCGGSSKSCYDSLNLSLAVGDQREIVLANRRAFGAALHVNPYRIVVPNQVHSANVRRVNAADAGAGAADHSGAIADTDALITNTPNLTLALHFADCACIFLVDPVHRAAGVAHAGWRGTVDGIVTKTIEAMTREFGTKPADLLAAVAPAIERHCYDVGQDVALRFAKAFSNDERVLKQSSICKWRLDLKTAYAILLQKGGVYKARIALSELCTSCNSDEFFSYRRDGVTGRMGGWLTLREQ